MRHVRNPRRSSKRRLDCQRLRPRAASTRYPSISVYVSVSVVRVPVRWDVDMSPPTIRMVVSNTDTSAWRSKSSSFSTQSRARLNSSFIPTGCEERRAHGRHAVV